MEAGKVWDRPTLHVSPLSRDDQVVVNGHTLRPNEGERPEAFLRRLMDFVSALEAEPVALTVVTASPLERFRPRGNEIAKAIAAGIAEGVTESGTTNREIADRIVEEFLPLVMALLAIADGGRDPGGIAMAAIDMVLSRAPRAAESPGVGGG